MSFPREQEEEHQPTSTPAKYQVVIVGAGVAGAASAYYLSQIEEVKSVCVLERGKVGRGSKEGKPLVRHATLLHSDEAHDAVNNNNSNSSVNEEEIKKSSKTVADDEEKVFTYARSSGTAVFENPNESNIKMIVNIFPCSSDEYIAHHGEDGARSYLRLAHKGQMLQKQLAASVLGDPKSQLTCLGSLYVCLEKDIIEFEKEFVSLQRLGARDIEWWEEDRTHKCAGPDFRRGIFFPHDAVIDSSSYAEGLMRSAISTGKVTLIEQCSPVTQVDTVTADGECRSQMAITTLKDGTAIRSDWVVLATGGLFLEPSLAGILKPCWSYLVSIPAPAAADTTNQSLQVQDSEASFRLQSPDSPNFFSWNFTHDWCLTKGYLRCSGEDHYSALKPPRSAHRCASLARWTLQKLPYLKTSPTSVSSTATSSEEQQGTTTLTQEDTNTLDGVAYTARYGVYSETPDHSPLVGTPHPNSRVCYIVGCNAWGQALMSFASSLIPSLLGFTTMSPQDKEDFSVLNIRRFALLDAVLADGHIPDMK